MGAQEPADDVARVAEVVQKLNDASVRVDTNARWDLMTRCGGCLGWPRPAST